MSIVKNFNNIIVNTITNNSTTATFITNITTSNIVATNFTGSNILNTNLTTNSLIVDTSAKFNCNVSMSNFTVTGLNDPVALTDAATKNYVDNKLAAKTPVSVATTTAGTLATSFANGQSIDSITLTTGMRILVKNQATATENGIYTVNASGAPTRTLDFDTGSAQASSYMFVNRGTTNADILFTCTNDAGSDIVGTNNLAFNQISGGSSGPITATNISGGSTGQILYQSAANTTNFITPGASGTILTSNGAGVAPSYQAAPGGTTSGTFTPTLIATSGGTRATNAAVGKWINSGGVVTLSVWIELAGAQTAMTAISNLSIGAIPTYATMGGNPFSTGFKRGLGVCYLQPMNGLYAYNQPSNISVMFSDSVPSNIKFYQNSANTNTEIVWEDTIANTKQILIYMTYMT